MAPATTIPVIVLHKAAAAVGITNEKAYCDKALTVICIKALPNSSMIGIKIISGKREISSLKSHFGVGVVELSDRLNAITAIILTVHLAAPTARPIVKLLDARMPNAMVVTTHTPSMQL